jgi:hypothetical protein
VLRVTGVTDQRLWSGLSASDMLRDHMSSYDPVSAQAEHKADDLFARLETLIEPKG